MEMDQNDNSYFGMKKKKKRIVSRGKYLIILYAY